MRLIHRGIRPEELLGGTRFHRDVQEGRQVWERIWSQLADDQGDVGRIQIDGAPMHVHVKGGRAQFLVNRGPSCAHVSKNLGFCLGPYDGPYAHGTPYDPTLPPEKIDAAFRAVSVRYLGDRPVAANIYNLLTGYQNPTAEQIASFEEVMCRCRLDVVKDDRVDKLREVVDATVCMPLNSALNIFLNMRATGSHVEAAFQGARAGGHAFDRWCARDVTHDDRLADWVGGLNEMLVFLCAWMRKKYGNQEMILPQEGETLPEAFVNMLGRYSSEDHRQQQIKVVNRLLNNMLFHDPANLSTFAGEVAGSSGANPYYTYCAALCALWGVDHGGAAPFAGNQMATAIQRIGITTEVGRINGFWDEWLARHKVALACGHAFLGGDTGDNRNWGLLDTLQAVFPGHDLIGFSNLFYQLGIAKVSEKKNLGFANVNVDGNTWVAGVIAGLWSDSPDDVEQAYAPFAAIRGYGVAKEDTYNATPKRIIVRPVPIRWWLKAPQLLELIPQHMKAA